MNNRSASLAVVLSTAFLAAALIVPSLASPGSKPAIQETQHVANAVQRQNTAQTGTDSGTMTVYTVPAGKKLVIESVWGRANSTGSMGAIGYFRTKHGPYFTEQWVTFEPQGTVKTRGHSTFNHAVKWFADAGTQVEFQIYYKTAAPNSSYTAGVAGYLIDK